MCKKLIPDYYASSIYEVSPDFYAKNGLKNLLLDLDNTLDSYRSNSPSEQVGQLINDLRAYGYQLVIVSNNKEARVKKYAEILGVPYLPSARKPFAYKFKRLMIKAQFNPLETILIGDQLLTDVLASKRAGIRSLLTEKIVPEDQWTTRINRLFDRPLRRKLKRQNRLLSWRNFYE